MDASKTAPSTGNALASVASTKPAPAPGIAKPSANPQVRHAEDRIGNQQSGANPKPTKAFAGRTSTPSSANTSGIERAMGAQADRLHKPRRR